MGIQLVNDAEAKLNSLVHKREVQAAKLSTEQQAREGHINLFTQAFQALVTKTGLIVSSIVVSPKMEAPKFYNTYLGAIAYLSKVLQDPSIEKHMRITEINENANNMKHTLEDTLKINIKDCVEQYNVVIKKLQASLKLNGFKVLILNLNTQNVGKTLFKDKPAEKAFTLGKHNIKIKLRYNRAKDYDEFKKVLKVHMVVYWSNSTNEKIMCGITTKARTIGPYKVELNKGTKSEEQNMFQKDCVLELTQKDIDGANIKLNINLDLQQLQSFEKTKTVAVKKLLRTKYVEEKYTVNEWTTVVSRKVDISTVIK